MEYTAGRGTTALGIVGTVLGGTALAGGNGLLGNLLGGSACSDGSNMPVNRYELNMNNELAAKDSEIGASYSRPKSNASITRICIIDALVIDGVKPATAAKIRTTGIPTMAVKCRCFPVRKKIKPNKIETCRPDTAMIWLIPLRRNPEFVS